MGVELIGSQCTLIYCLVSAHEHNYIDIFQMKLPKLVETSLLGDRHTHYMLFRELGLMLGDRVTKALYHKDL